MGIRELGVFYRNALRKVPSKESTFILAIKTFINGIYKKAGLKCTHTEDMATKTYNLYNEHRAGVDSHGDAWKRCETSINNEVMDAYYQAARAKGYSREDARKRCKDFVRKRGGGGKPSLSVLYDFGGLADVLPNSGKGGLFGDIRDQATRLNARFQTEERRPSGGNSWRNGESSRGSSNGFYYTEERSPHGASYTYTRTTYTTTTEARESHSSSRSYSTHEFSPSDRIPRPQGSSSRPSPPPRRPSYYNAPPPSSSYEAPPPSSSYKAPPPSSSYNPPPPPPPSTKQSVCLYTILGISRSASADDIKKAFRKLVMKWHPDRAQEADKQEATERMAEINQANDVLGDAKERAWYDRTGRVPGISDV